MKDLEVLLTLARQVVEAADVAKRRGQKVEPTQVRLSITVLRAELRLWEEPEPVKERPSKRLQHGELPTIPGTPDEGGEGGG